MHQSSNETPRRKEQIKKVGKTARAISLPMGG